LSGQDEEEKKWKKFRANVHDASSVVRIYNNDNAYAVGIVLEALFSASG